MSEGLILLTTCGKMSRAVTYGLGEERKKISKEVRNNVSASSTTVPRLTSMVSLLSWQYWVEVDGIITDEAIEKLSGGVAIGEGEKQYVTGQCEAWRIEEEPLHLKTSRRSKIRDGRHGPTSWVAVTIKEGKNRQVRRMTAAVGFPTLRLVRVRIGGVTLEGLESGDIKEVTTDEILSELGTTAQMALNDDDTSN